VLCNKQFHNLDIKINDPKATYNWSSTNGFTSNLSSVSLTKAGTYKATVTSSLGCMVSDEITINTNQFDIDAEFFLSSQAFLNEEVILINISEPIGKQTEWIFSKGVEVLQQTEQFIVLKFKTLGEHQLAIKQTQGECFETFSKTIFVEEPNKFSNNQDNDEAYIKEFNVTPNPNNGKFLVAIDLEKSAPISLRLLSYVGQQNIENRTGTNQKKYIFEFDTNVAAGTYFLVLETANQRLVKKIIIF
jgi:hypothetical protein